MQAQNTNKADVCFTIGGKEITVASNGDIISITGNTGPSNADSKNIVVTSYAGVSIDDDREISVWKGNYFPSVFYFPIDKHLLIRDYRSNNIMLMALDELINTRQIVQNLDTIEIIGASSPTGREDHNLKLALSRCMALRSYLRWKHLSFVDSFPIKFNIIGVDWVGYRILKETEPFLTTKKTWDMLQYAAIRLKMKDGSYIIPGSDRPKNFSKQDNIRQDAQPVYKRDTVFIEKHYTEVVTERDVEVVNVHDTVFLKCDTVYIGATLPDNSASNDLGKMPSPGYMALKTNLLYDAALLPNLTAEWYIGKQWSIAVEGNWSWWNFDRPIQNGWYHRIQAAGVELRRWVNSPYPLRGHAFGIYSMIGNYDVRFFTQNEYSKGWLSYQSWSAGLSYAYSFPIARKFNMELELALGHVGGRYYRYDYCLDHEHWAQRSVHNRNYWGPTRVGVSLVWLLSDHNEKK
ncbi:hypothetical protein FACS1894182_11220 [Bacteroidia bacterium]|nr:hypothetical protein FACS1894182_11220 [Bacteroidia bacterium]